MAVRSYFMAEHEQDAVIGRVVRECADEGRRAVTLQSEARYIGDELSRLAKFLHEHPELITFDNDSSPPEFFRSHNCKPEEFDSIFLDAAKIKQLCIAIRESIERHLRLFKEKQKFGI